MKDLTGIKTGKLTVVEKIENNLWKCQCECGNIKNLVSRVILSKNSKEQIKSCGCNKLNPYLSMIGTKIGRWSVIKKILPPDYIKSKKQSYFECKCECGIIKIVSGILLKNKKSMSCGCFRNELFSHTNSEEVKIQSAKVAFEKYSKNGLAFLDFYMISQQDCFYCGLKAFDSNLINIFAARANKHNGVSDFAKNNGNFYYNGLDRISSKIGHIISNMVPCCKICNTFKLDMTLEKFKNHIDNFNLKPFFIKVNELNHVDHLLKNININNKNNQRNKFHVQCKISVLYPEKCSNNDNKILKRISDIRSLAKRRDIFFDLTVLQCAELITFKCNYCNELAFPENGRYNGIDRIDNSIGYISDNCVSCCRYCNFAKMNYPVENFIIWMNKIHNHQLKTNYIENLLEKIK